ncbi:hypothetical protein [Undibacterium terreum]|uniref:Uncharacterized protein n=1 Tax=Undibacterium terreum TaxID=1224302 RepID=A0A916U606_9BURK|nr:hypothetical protein [Undibacterium terreum]GGC61147.1 hypothetical protein GCM10011396_05180 [Undibacterium terreum]
MSTLKTAVRFFSITLYFVLMGPVFALCILIAQDAILRATAAVPLPHLSDYVFVLTMYWPSTFTACLVPGTVVGYAYAVCLYGLRKGHALNFSQALFISGLLGLLAGAALGMSSGMALGDAFAGCLAAIACAAMLWMLGIGRPSPITSGI